MVFFANLAAVISNRISQWHTFPSQRQRVGQRSPASMANLQSSPRHQSLVQVSNLQNQSLMAKDNLFLGMARGKVGDVVFSRLNGVQVTRARNRAPKNPQSPLQLSQRVIMKTASLAYSFLQDIANHSFEGYAEGTPSQSRFIKCAVSQMRAQVADVLQSGSDEDILECEEFNFSNAQEVFPVLRPYQLSEGTLNDLSLAQDAAHPSHLLLTGHGESVGGAEARTMTYAEVCRFLGCDQGDQVTICLLGYTGGSYLDSPCFSRFEVARFILEPKTGGMEQEFDLTANYHNERDQVPETWYVAATLGAQSSESSIDIQTDMTAITDTPVEGGLAGFAVIRSKRVGDTWLRSTSHIVIPDNLIFQGADFGSAVRSFRNVVSSNLYLNQSV